MSDSKSGENSPTAETLPELDTKKASSYTYWVNNNPNFFGEVGPSQKGPTKIDPALAEKLKKYSYFSKCLTSYREEESKTSGHSAWNTSGTW